MAIGGGREFRDEIWVGYIGLGEGIWIESIGCGEGNQIQLRRQKRI